MNTTTTTQTITTTKFNIDIIKICDILSYERLQEWQIFTLRCMMWESRKDNPSVDGLIRTFVDKRNDDRFYKGNKVDGYREQNVRRFFDYATSRTKSIPRFNECYTIKTSTKTITTTITE